jgi:predicted alpha/beta superfamily hydrolase
MNRAFLLLSVGIILGACHQNQDRIQKPSTAEREPKEIFGFYSPPETKMIYSEFVSDSFKIFTSLPQKYNYDTLSKYPLIIVLDANGYFESIVAELKLGTLTQDLPKAIFIGIGYRSFWAMDSLRDRDYTYPAALPEDSFKVSGGAPKFKKFINRELLPKIFREYRVNEKQIILLGHSLGGYFVLYYMLDSLENREFKITNFISASPYLSYGSRYLLNLERKLSSSKNELPVKLYLSVGSLERDTSRKENAFQDFKTQLESRHYKGAQLKLLEFGNFDHMDAAMPGFMKGLVFVFEN